MKKGKKSKRWVLLLAFAVIVTTVVSTATLSRYLTAARGAGVVSIAAVDMSVASTVLSTDIAPGESQALNFSVVNFTGEKTSDVTQEYTVEVSTAGNLPLIFTLSSADADPSNHALTPDGANKWSGGLLAHSVDTTHIYVLTVTWQAGDNSSEYAGEIEPITVTVRANQQATV